MTQDGSEEKVVKEQCLWVKTQWIMQSHVILKSGPNT